MDVPKSHMLRATHRKCIYKYFMMMDNWLDNRVGKGALPWSFSCVASGVPSPRAPWKKGFSPWGQWSSIQFKPFGPPIILIRANADVYVCIHQDRVPFVIPDKVPWPLMANALNSKFMAANGRSLSNDNLQYLAMKAFSSKSHIVVLPFDLQNPSWSW